MREPFLKEAARDLLSVSGGNLEAFTVVLPNKRAGLFLRRYLQELIGGPVIEPWILPVADFFRTGYPYPVADTLSLNYELFLSYQKLINPKEEFDRFLPWGEMLLKDFDELDKYLVNASHLFTVLADHRELIETFDYLGREEKDYIRRFWNTLEPAESEEQKGFTFLWQNLHPLYEQFREKLREKQMVYEGMVYRDAAEGAEQFSLPFRGQQIYFTGFHVLNRCEETIFRYFRDEMDAKFYWDADIFYLDDPGAEAGRFMRTYLEEFPSRIAPGDDFSGEREIHVTGASNATGQALIAGQLLSEKPHSSQNTAIVLPDENLLYPVLQALPKEVEEVNVTMGFPVAQSGLFLFLEQFREWRKKSRETDTGTAYHFKALSEWLAHPFVRAFHPEWKEKSGKETIENHTYYFSATGLGIKDPDFLPLFTETADFRIILRALQQLSLRLMRSEWPESLVEKEVLYQFYLLLNRYHDILDSGQIRMGFQQAMKTLLQMTRRMKVPFSGEPLRGLQVMGLLETRNLDFETLIIPGMNDSVMPSPPPSGSYIPYSLRKGFGMPTLEHHDAFYAYYFYRLLQRAQHVYLLYDNSEQAKSGSISRFIEQLKFETGWKVHTLAQQPRINLTEPAEIFIVPDQRSKAYLDNFLTQENAVLSPTSLRTWMECRLRFYYKYIAGLGEKTRPEESIDPGTFGNLVHDGMYYFYEALAAHHQSRRIEAEWLENAGPLLESAWEKSIRKNFFIPPEKPVKPEGAGILAAGIVRKYMQAVVKLDKTYAPFEMLNTEEKIYREIEISLNGEKRKVKIGGRVDRVDRKDGLIRVIDYKTGNVKRDTVEALEDLFIPDRPKFSGELLQILVYGYILAEMFPEVSIKPLVLSLKNHFRSGEAGEIYVKNAEGKKQAIEDIGRQKKELEKNLSEALVELFSEAGGYPATAHVERCAYCPYAQICRRD